MSISEGWRKIAKLGEKIRGARLRWYGHVKRREAELCREKDTGDGGAGKKEKGKAEEEVVGCGAGRIWRVWVLWRRMWLTEGCGGRRCAVATPNRES